MPMLASCYLFRFRFTGQGGVTEEREGLRDGPTWVIMRQGKVWHLGRKCTPGPLPFLSKRLLYMLITWPDSFVL